MHPKDLSIKDFTYSLPEDKIANYPLVERDASKLLIYKNVSISEDIYRNIASHIPERSLLVFNNTRVIAARIFFQKATGGVIEIFCLEPTVTDISSSMTQRGTVQWNCLVGGASKWKPGQLLSREIKADTGAITLNASYLRKDIGSFVIEFSWSPSTLSFAEVLHAAGAIPLPPYIKRKAEAADTERYQTIYAEHEGSVAAPTAGLHFTDVVFTSLKGKNIQMGFVTLHVGAGTFKPVKSDTMAEHDMHAEYISVTRQLVRQLLDQSDQPVIAVGTTSLRTLESLYWLGVKFVINNGRFTETGETITINQWEAYDLASHDIPVQTALTALLDYLDKNRMEQLVAKTQIIIAPGYKVKMIKGLITNFHQPQSTLLLLVAALVGKEWRRIYEYALAHQFRFLSYGDGCLLWATES